MHVYAARLAAMEVDMLTLITWCGDAVALVTAIAMLKDTFFDRSTAKQLLHTLHTGVMQARHGPGWPTLAEMRPALRFFIRIGLLTCIAAAAGVCVAFPHASNWETMVLRTALALHMATHVPCPWIHWITVGDVRSKRNDPPGVERRAD